MPYVVIGILIFSGWTIYVAESKGRPGWFYGPFAALLCLATLPFGWLGFLLPAGLLWVLELLPARDLRGARPVEKDGAAGEGDSTEPARSQPPPRPAADAGVVCCAAFSLQEQADYAVEQLKAEAVPAYVVSDDGGGTMPYFGVLAGYRVMIDAANWDEAMAVLRGESLQNGE